MKIRMVVSFFSVLLCGVMMQTPITWANDAADSGETEVKGLCGVISVDQYIGLAKLIFQNDAKGDAATTAIIRTVEKADTLETRLNVLAEISVTLMAVVSRTDSPIESLDIVRAILRTAVALSQKHYSDGVEEQILFCNLVH